MKIHEIKDQETKLLASLAESLKGEYIGKAKQAWERSPFSWILTCPSRQRGKIGEQLIAGWCAARDLNVVRSPDSQADRIIEGKRVEIKFSTLWASGVYKFQQIRDQNYDYLLCFGVSPLEAHAWIMKKSEMPLELMPPQHGGSMGRDTRWLSFRPDTIPTRLNDFGGSLGAVLKVLKSLRP